MTPGHLADGNLPRIERTNHPRRYRAIPIEANTTTIKADQASERAMK
jgi:hypothetical protein